MGIELPYQFYTRDYQKEAWDAILDEAFRRGILIIPRRNGKDILSWNALICKAFQRVGLYFYMGPYYNQIRQIIWQGSDKDGRRFLDYIPRELINGKPTKIDMRIELVNGSQIKLCGSDNIDSIVGTNPFGIVFTEFSLHKPDAWNYLRPILAENGGWALFNGTPRGLNHFYQMAELAKKDDGWFHQYLTCEDTGIPSKEDVEYERRSGMPESLVQQEFYCSWTSSSEEVLIPLDIVQPSLSVSLSKEDFNFAPRILGVDVAYAAKGDQAVIAKRQGRFLHPMAKYQGLDNMSFATEVAKVINDWRPQVVFVDAGRGEGVISRLWQLGYEDKVIPVHFGGRPYSELYANKRAEIWCRMREWFLAQNQPLIPEDPKLIAALTAPTFTVNDKGYIQLESKIMMKRRGVHSPDEGDALALTFAEEWNEPIPVTEEEKVIANAMSVVNAVEQEYDPLDYFNQMGRETFL